MNQVNDKGVMKRVYVRTVRSSRVLDSILSWAGCLDVEYEKARTKQKFWLSYSKL